VSDNNPIPAATVVIARESLAGDGVELLFLLRNSRLVFHGGHWVFPGGRIDDCDYEACQGNLEFPAARKAAVRETKEEAGIEIIENELIHTAHWTTPPRLPRRFSTWFFLYPLREQVEVVVDKEEILDHRWLTPDAALRAAQSKEFELPRPTLATVQDLQGHRSLDNLVASVTDGNIRVFPENSDHYRPREMGYLPTEG
jgi:8-oxo-dGTP pyrophosphatase MutT (NUDIX family)